jgi:hypothetical protein
MKRLVLTGVAILALALGAFAQGVINLDNSTTPYGVTVENAAGNGSAYYSGTFGMEVWELGGRTSVPAGINNYDAAPFSASCLLAYQDMVAAGFKWEATYAKQVMVDGTFSLGNLTMSDVTPPGSQVVLALAVWNNSAQSWRAATHDALFLGGVVAFLTPTVPPAAPGLPPPIGADINAGWTAVGTDLVMEDIEAAIPEPGSLALAGLGAAILWTFPRWRKCRSRVNICC